MKTLQADFVLQLPVVRNERKTKSPEFYWLDSNGFYITNISKSASKHYKVIAVKLTAEMKEATLKKRSDVVIRFVLKAETGDGWGCEGVIWGP